ncbi:ZIP family metal transporter [Oceanospirillum linum]|uniref:Divalent cation transporter n=1 Tax=Oceanospirillum linum TaxID=966 RepID=A0A1T1HBB0_OCELI|nr:divalent cation transporter [Oceanospirillum linum]OOV87102.1 divalent cation transporter [Oceanospirillum linum]SEF74435.1 zinc transporter, ZIP family [Oleiphilus messinensis]SMP16830.1 zinc transporter, ZIP family [Oceanospirillum linum]
MSEALKLALLYSTLAAITIPLGGFLARIERFQNQWLEQELKHSVIAYGAGVLLAAVALVLVPEGQKSLSTVWVAVAVLSGGLMFMVADIILSRQGGSTAQLLAMLLDFMPEAMALGASLALGSESGLLLALLMALQNLPEGFNAYREMIAVRPGQCRKILIFFILLVPIGPFSAWVGFVWLSEMEMALGFIMLWATGGILYLTFQDIAPQVRLDKDWWPPMAAVAGFLTGLLGQQILVHG